MENDLGKGGAHGFATGLSSLRDQAASRPAHSASIPCAGCATLLAERDTPEVIDFAKAVQLEAWHQRDRWGADHDAGKAPLDWFWLIGYLAQKAATAQMAGDTDKALHHTISTASALANWHLALSGGDNQMRPGIADPGENWICGPCDAVNFGIRNLCRFCKQPRAAIATEAGTATTENTGVVHDGAAIAQKDHSA